MTDPREDLSPGWVDRMAAKLKEATTEVERAEVTGLTPRRVWRGNYDISQASRLRGAHARKRKLDKILGAVPKDEE